MALEKEYASLCKNTSDREVLASALYDVVYDEEPIHIVVGEKVVTITDFVLGGAVIKNAIGAYDMHLHIERVEYERALKHEKSV